MTDAQLSLRFKLSQFTFSDTAIRKGIDNAPTPAHIDNLRRLADRLEKVADLLQAPLIITSVYRCLELNRAIGSQDSSRHVLGLAADFGAPRFGTPLEVCHQIHKSGIEFDQLIHEFGRWVHFGLWPIGSSPRFQLLTIDRLGTRPGLWEVRK
jgi:hypothetical protein